MRALRVVLARPRGFCAGVERAIEIVERAVALYGAPVYVLHEIVHNRRVVERLHAKGARFVEDLNDIPLGAVTVFSAHGVSAKVERRATARGLQVVDATCPLVAKVHLEGRRYREAGAEVVLIGHRGHAEVAGTMGQIPGGVLLVENLADVARLKPKDPARLAYVTQTTLSVDDTRAIIAALEARFPSIDGPDLRDICYATQNRQRAVRALTEQVDVLLVVGAANSSNSNRLREIGEEHDLPSYLIGDAEALDHRWLEGAGSVGITAGASAPEELVWELLAALRDRYRITLDELDGIDERVRFKLPDAVAGVAESTATSLAS